MGCVIVVTVRDVTLLRRVETEERRVTSSGGDNVPAVRDTETPNYRGDNGDTSPR